MIWNVLREVLLVLICFIIAGLVVSALQSIFETEKRVKNIEKKLDEYACAMTQEWLDGEDLK